MTEQIMGQRSGPEDLRLRRRREAVRIFVLRLVLILAVLGLWQAAASWRWVNPFFSSSPAEIGEHLYELFSTAEIGRHLWVTLYEASIGFILGSISGILIGLTLARFALLNSVLGPLIGMLNSVPRIALVSLFVLWFGIGVSSKIALVWSLVVFTMLVNTYGGATNVDRDLLTMTRLLGASQRQIMRKLILPASVPWIFAGLRLSVAHALTGAIVGEMIVAQSGLGFLISSAAATFNTGGVMAVLVVVAIVAVFLNLASEWLERRLMGQRNARQGGAWGGAA